ncbi:MAG: hypothetical protein COV70_02535 [Parcubacteria group bacterium CG11_big_fil_rev_8_21_14_0_20_39_22]|nr:MAG: hypothetical protein COV70_02535 [Parcubacteria group bacterium CG11_big_fil_rev_8_21_14_0_20_39_22]
MVKKAMKIASKNGLSPLKLEHIFILLLGIVLFFGSGSLYGTMTPVGQVIILIIYLGLLVGIAPIPLPVFRRKFSQVFFAGLLSGVLDSYIVLDQSRRLRTVENGQDEEGVMNSLSDQEVKGERAKFLVLLTLAALIGGLIIWFGEVYAAGLYNNNGRTGVLSALYVIPPVLVFLTMLGLHAERLAIRVVPNKSSVFKTRDVVEFGAGIILLLVTHNPLFCLAVLLVYSVITRQDERLLNVWKYHTEVNVMLVLLLALVAGSWLVLNVVDRFGIGSGEFAPVLVAGVQSVLWGPLYNDPSVNFWIMITTLSTGALLLPISSLVGVMLFKTGWQWLIYIRYSIPYAVLWYVIMRIWILLTLETPVGVWLEQWAHSGVSHH